MKRIFYETTLVFELNPLPRTLGPFTSNMGQKWVTLVPKRATSGVSSTFWMFPERQEFCVGSVVYGFEEESEPVVWSYFVWHFIVGLYMRHKGATCSGWSPFPKRLPLIVGGSSRLTHA